MRRIIFSRLAGLTFLICLMLSSIATARHSPIHVIFINPGHADQSNPTGAFWPEASRFAQAVANDLGIKLEILHAKRDTFRMQTLVKQVLQRKHTPDYLLLVNERFALNEIFASLDKAQIPFFLAYNQYSKHLQQPEPRIKHKFWLGSLVPDNEFAGNQLAEQLIHSLDGAQANILAFSGDDITSASLQRVEGLKRAVKYHPEATLVHLSPGEWRYDIPEKSTLGLLRRYPDINAIWAANGAMGMGALKATQADSIRLQKVNIASINWDRDEINALEEGQLYASVGGHFMTAGWSLVMLYDYHHGYDFIHDGGSYQQRRIFGAITRDNIADYLPILRSRAWDSLNYKLTSKTYNTKLKEYQFSLDHLLFQGESTGIKVIEH